MNNKDTNEFGNDNGIDEESEFKISLYRSWHVSCWELVHIFLSVYFNGNELVRTKIIFAFLNFLIFSAPIISWRQVYF